MRHPRLKPSGEDTFIHVYNRTVGSTVEFPFSDVEKEEFIRRLKKLDKYYAIDVLAAQVMGNHFHAIIHIPAEQLTNEETARRYSEYHDGKLVRALNARSGKVDLYCFKQLRVLLE